MLIRLFFKGLVENRTKKGAELITSSKRQEAGSAQRVSVWACSLTQMLLLTQPYFLFSGSQYDLSYFVVIVYEKVP